ncbi:MAG: hypothetical protein JKY43_04995 [Phycisphaerales bacterium]|nr:hypothetical protein [Phycisphaerales bacterium]
MSRPTPQSTPPSSDALFSLSNKIEVFKEAEAGELSTEEWDGLNEYEIMLRTAANIITGVAVDSYLIEMVKDAGEILKSTRESIADRR